MKYTYIIFTALLVATSSLSCSSDNETTPDDGKPLTEGLNSLVSQGIKREFYLKLPSDYTPDTQYPLIIAFHGTEGDYTKYTLNSYYNLHGAVGDEAILVYPNALPNDNGVTQWDYHSDIEFFDDLFEHLSKRLSFNLNRVFAVGHSSGAGLAHAVGCERGDIVRAIAPVAGALLNFQSCIGEVAVLQVQGTKDTMVPPRMVEPGRDYWAGINGCSLTEKEPVFNEYCFAYVGCDSGFPVNYCEHDLEDFSHDYPGHAWPKFAGDTIWQFFKQLDEKQPSEELGSGEIPTARPGFASFKLLFPEGFVGVPEILAIALFPHDHDPDKRHEVAPTHILNANIPFEHYEFGAISEYSNVPVDFGTIEFGDYVFAATVYVEGGNYPIPTTDQDYVAYQKITIDDPVLVLETPLELQHLKSFK